MQIIAPIDLATLRQHERSTRANACLGRYGMCTYSPQDEFQLVRANFEPDDWQRLYLIEEFTRHTNGKTGRVIDLNFEDLSPTAKARVQSFTDPPSGIGLSPVDLRMHPQLAIIIVTADIHDRALVIIDGNHRAIAQYRNFGPVAGIPAIVCIHGKIEQWPYAPIHSRNRKIL